jgi:serine/threonine-protein kinase HipA
VTQPDDEQLQALRLVDAADVLKGGRRAATLTRTRGGIELRYLDEWVSLGRPALASTLPVTTEPVVTAGAAVPAYFAGLLPEGRRLGVLRRAVKTSADDELSLLLAVGADAIGDVQVVPAGIRPEAEIPPRVNLGAVGSTRFRDLLDELGIAAQRVALPGIQDKTSAAMINLPVARAGERFILKLNPVGEYPHLVENEAFFLDAAGRSGLMVPPHELVTDADGVPGLLVRRFDRTTVDGRPHALAVEDGCQAAGLPPAEKYRLTADRVFAILAVLCDAPAVAGRELLRQLAFAYVSGNGDAHAKNFSVVQGLDGERRVAPAYDLPCSYMYGDRTMALGIGQRHGSEFSAADFVGLGAQLGVPERSVRRMLGELAQRVELWLADMNALPFDAGQLRKLRRVVLHRRDQLAGA